MITMTMTIKSGMARHIYNPITGYVEAGDPRDSLEPQPIWGNYRPGKCY